MNNLIGYLWVLHENITIFTTIETDKAVSSWRIDQLEHNKIMFLSSLLTKSHIHNNRYLEQ